MKTLFKSVIITSLAIIFLFASGKLFFPDRLDQIIQTIRSLTHTSAENKGNLRLGYSTPLPSLNPASGEAAVRERLFTIYETLIRTDKYLQIEPGLAVSFGSIDKLIWEFRIRPGVRFHDGSDLDFADIEASMAYARDERNSQISELLGAIAAVEKVDADIFRITTSEPDPLLLQKLTLVPIFPSRAEKELQVKPVGTGPYQFKSLESGTLSVARFDDYWGDLPPYETVVMHTFETKAERTRALTEKSVDILADVPPEIVREFSSDAYEIKAHPSTEADFLLMNFSGLFADKDIRQAAILALNRAEIARLGFGFAEPATQFVGRGVYGYDADIKIPEADLAEAGSLVKKHFEFEKPPLQIDLPKGLEFFGDYIASKLKIAGFDAVAVYHDGAKLRDRIFSNKSDMYFLGWRTELGDASEFLQAVAHSPGGSYGAFNSINYVNEEVDGLIEAAAQEVVAGERLKMLRRAMQIITEQDIIGIPLFSPQILYAVSSDVEWEPRTDGYLFAFEVQ